MKQYERPVPDRVTSAMLDERMRARIEDKQEEWQEEGIQAVLAGNPRRSWYLEQMAGRLPAMVQAALTH